MKGALLLLLRVFLIPSWKRSATPVGGSEPWPNYTGRARKSEDATIFAGLSAGSALFGDRVAAPLHLRCAWSCPFFWDMVGTFFAGLLPLGLLLRLLLLA